MEGWMWLILVSMFVVGGLFGAVFARSKKPSNTQKVTTLESSLNDARTELKDYKEDVSQHFGKTAELFDTLTNDYRAVHEHLATGSEALCGDQVKKIEATMPENKRLDDAPTKPAQTEPETTTTETEAGAVDTEVKEDIAADKITAETPAEQVASAEESTTETKEETVPTEEKSPLTKIDDKAAEARTIH